MERKTRDFEPQDNADLSQGDSSGQLGESIAWRRTGAVEPRILIDDGDLISRPTEFHGALGKGVLACG
ncbi:MAG: hypothetical protein ACRERU_03965 [Methylococcales bacterium]